MDALFLVILYFFFPVAAATHSWMEPVSLLCVWLMYRFKKCTPGLVKSTSITVLLLFISTAAILDLWTNQGWKGFSNFLTGKFHLKIPIATRDF